MADDVAKGVAPGKDNPPASEPEPPVAHAAPEPPPGLTIAPSSVTLIRGQAQVFRALPDDGQPVEWAQAPEPSDKYGKVDGRTGVYTSPPRVYVSKSVVLVATRGKQFATATVNISSTPFWTGLLGTFWVASAGLLLYAAVHYWPEKAACDFAPRVSPPAINLAQNDTQQFMIAGAGVNPAATWAIDKQMGSISPSGLYTAPPGPYGTGTAPKNGEVITVTASDPNKKLQIVSAQVVLTNSPTIAIDPGTAAVPPGGNRSFSLRGSPGAPVVWSVEPLAGIGSIDKSTGEFSAPSSIGRSKLVTVFANVKGAANAPGTLTAAALVILCQEGSGEYCTSCAAAAGVSSIVIFVFIMGALGSYVHAAASFATFAGNRQLASSWSWWYVLRPLIGGLLAVLGYFVLSGGLTSVTDPSDLFKVAAYSGMIGMFAEQATIKFGDIFDAVFRPSDKQKDGLNTTQPAAAAKPVLTKASVVAAGGKFVVTLTGTGFVSDSRVKMDAADIDAARVKLVNATTLTATLDANPPATAKFTVVNNTPSGPVESEAKPLS